MLLFSRGEGVDELLLLFRRELPPFGDFVKRPETAGAKRSAFIELADADTGRGVLWLMDGRSAKHE